MACKYYLNGKVSKLYTELYGYIDDTAPEKRNPRRIYEILRDNGIVAQDNKKYYVVQGPDMRNQMPRLRELDRIDKQYPGLVSYKFLKKTPPTYNTKANRLHSFEINEEILKSIPENGTIQPEQSFTKREELENYLLEREINYKKTMTEEELISLIALSENTSDQSRMSDLLREEEQATQKKVTHLQNAFAKAGIQVETVMDETLEVLGQVDAKVAGEPVTVRLNAEGIKEDTVYHEFGHIYIDMLGVENPVVARAIAELRGTDLYSQVQQKYPELSGERLDKEVLATAIGMEGAKLTRKNPSRLQVIINQIFREFAKMLNRLGITATPSTAATLAQEMFLGQLRTSEMINPISSYRQQSKGEQNIVKLGNEIRVRVEAELRSIKNMPEETAEQRKAKEKALEKQESLKRSLTKITKVEHLVNFVKYNAEHISKLEGKYNNLIEAASKNDIEKMPALLSEMYQMKRELDALDTLKSLRGIIKEKQREAEASPIKQPEVDVNKLATMEERIAAMLNVADELEYRYQKDIIPMMADSLIQYHNVNVDTELQSIIDNIENKGRWRSALSSTDPELRELRERRDEGKLSEEEFVEERTKLAVQKVKNKMIPTRQHLINELTAAYKDKSGYSYMLDPLIYSNDQAIQLFAKLLRTANIKKNDRTLDFKTDLNEAYTEFAQGQGQFNVEALNDDLVEEIEIAAYKDGKKQPIKVLSLVQPTDLAKYNAAEAEMYKSLDKKYGKPRREDYESQEDYDTVMANWKKNTTTVKMHIDAVDAWLSNNSEGIEGWREELKKMDSARGRQKALLDKLKKDGKKDTVQYELAFAKLEAMNLERSRNITSKGTPKGALAKPKMSLYTNPKWAKIQADPRLKKYYDFVIQEIRKGQDMIGRDRMHKNSWDKYSYLMPSIRKEGIDRLKEQGVWKSAKDALSEAFTLQATDDMYGKYNSISGELEKSVPVYYTNIVDSKDVSRDIASSLYQFRDMAHNFAEKSQIVGTAMVMRDLMLNREVLATGSSGGMIMSQLAKQLGIKTPQLEKGESNTVKHLTEFIDQQLFGQQEIKVNLGGVDMNKAINSLNTFTAISNLSFNFLQAANQTILDNLTNLQEGIAGEFYSAKDIAWAKAEYMKQGAGIRDIGKFVPESKLGKAIELFDALVEVTDREGKRIVGGKGRKLADIGNLMSLQAAAEHEMAGTRMLALLHATEALDSNGKTIMNDNGKPANLWDMLIIDERGKMSIDPRVANVSKNDITMQLGGISRRTNQTKGNFDRSMLERRWYGKAIMLFRRYFNPGFRRRFGHGEPMHVDEELGTVTQGMYMSFITMLQEAYDAKSINVKAVYDDMTEVEKQNVKRTLMELGSIVAAMAIVAALSKIDDDDETWVSNFMLYQAKRYQTEMMQWNPVFGYKDIVRMAKSPAATIRPLENGLGLVEQIAFYELPYAVGIPIDPKHIYYQRRTGRFNKGDRKIRKSIEDMLPIIRGIQKSKTPEDAIKWFSK
jgi:hypothetical protein